MAVAAVLGWVTGLATAQTPGFGAPNYLRDGMITVRGSLTLPETQTQYFENTIGTNEYSTIGTYDSWGRYNRKEYGTELKGDYLRGTKWDKVGFRTRNYILENNGNNHTHNYSDFIEGMNVEFAYQVSTASQAAFDWFWTTAWSDHNRTNVTVHRGTLASATGGASSDTGLLREYSANSWAAMFHLEDNGTQTRNHQPGTGGGLVATSFVVVDSRDNTEREFTTPYSNGEKRDLMSLEDVISRNYRIIDPEMSWGKDWTYYSKYATGASQSIFCNEDVDFVIFYDPTKGDQSDPNIGWTEKVNTRYAMLAKGNGNYTRIPNVSTSNNHSTAKTYPRRVYYKNLGEEGVTEQFEAPMVWNAAYNKYIAEPTPAWMIANGKVPAAFTKYIMLIAKEKLGVENGQNIP